MKKILLIVAWVQVFTFAAIITGDTIFRAKARGEIDQINQLQAEEKQNQQASQLLYTLGQRIFASGDKDVIDLAEKVGFKPTPASPTTLTSGAPTSNTQPTTK